MTGGTKGRDRLRAAIALALAPVLLGDVYYPIARAGFLVRSPVGLLWPLLAAASLLAVVFLALRTVRLENLASVGLLGFAGITLGALVVLNLVPPIARDELTYHLAMPALYARAGRVIEVPFADASYYPMALEMLYTPLVAHGWATAAKYLHLSFGLASAALLFLYLSPRVRSSVALAGAVLLFTTPTVTALAASAYVDLGLLLYATIGVLAVLRWSETGQTSYLILGALGAGCAVAVKYNGLLVVMLLGCATLVIAERRGLRAVFVSAVTFGLLSLVPLLPWLLKNAWETGNPLFPLFNHLLGGRPLPAQPELDVFSTRRMLYGESWWLAALAPIRVFLTGRDGVPAQFDGVFNPLYLLAAAAAFVQGRFRRERLLSAFAFIFLVMVFFLISFRSRYALAAVAPLVLVFAAVLADWTRQAGARKSAAMAVVVAGLVFNAAHLALFWRRVDPLAYLTGRQSQTEYVARFVPEYPVTVYANEHLPSQASVYLAFLGDRGYYWKCSYTYDYYYSGTTLLEAVRGARDPSGVVDALRARHIEYLAAADWLLLRFLRDNLDDAGYERWQAFAASHLRPLDRQAGFGLYQIL